ncbi:hypothetical protein ES705_10547 [subsurface metagenome]
MGSNLGRMMEKIEIDKDVPLNPGDIIEMHYITAGMGIITATQNRTDRVAARSAERFRDFELSTAAWLESCRIYIQIKEPAMDDPQVAGVGVAITAAIIGAAIIGAGVIGLMSLDKILLIMESPAAKVAVVGFGSLAAAAAIALVISILGRSK